MEKAQAPPSLLRHVVMNEPRADHLFAFSGSRSGGRVSCPFVSCHRVSQGLRCQITSGIYAYGVHLRTLALS